MLVACAVAARIITDRGGLQLELAGERHELRVAPRDLATLYQQMIAFARLRKPPVLLVTETLGGSGALWMSDLIVVGVDELDAVARQVWREKFLNGRRVASAQFWAPASEEARVTIDRVRAAVLRFALAHEVGHAVAWESGSARDGIAGEYDADQVAAIILRALQLDGLIEPLVAETLGCRTRPHLCSHPQPHERRQAFRAGIEAYELHVVGAVGNYVYTGP